MEPDSVLPKHISMQRASASFMDGFDLQVPQYTPKAPNVAGLVGQLDYPVSLYTGVSNISVPIYEISVSNLKIPIMLSYKSSGICVNQEASWVGLGWTLDAGGFISRTIRCGDDFYEYVPPGGSLTEGYITAPDISPATYKDYITQSELKVRLKKDSEPDIFYFSIPGKAGKFIIDKSRGIVLVDKSINVNIKYFNDDVFARKYFIITSPDGIKYTFGKYEKTSSYKRTGYLNQNMANATKFDEYENELNQIYSSPFEYTSSWMLTDICTTEGQHVIFEYEEESFQTPVQESAEKYHILRYNSGKILGPSQGDVVYSCSKTLVNTWRLSKISWNSGTVIFESSARDDEKGIIDSTNPQKLSTIKVYDKKGSVIKEVDFNYSYFNDSYVGKYPHVFKRLKLTGISNAADRNCNYKFDYYDGAFPAKNSKNTDYWGYSNGINQGANYYCPMVYNNVYYEGADKSSNFNYMLIGTLKSVVSPTKGKTTFVYEANRYKVTPNTALVTHNIKEGINIFNEYNYDTYNQYPKTVKHEFTLSVNTQMKIYGFAENEGCIEDKDVRYDHDDNATFKISKLKSDGSKQLIFYYPTPSEMRMDCSYTFPTKTIELPKGNFIIEAEAHAKDTWYAFFYEYNKTETVVSDSVITGGGLRIKSIAGGENKTYGYEDGKLLIDPIFGNERRVATYEFIASQLKYIWYSTDYLVQQSEASIPMSTMKAGNIFGYSSVTERMGNVTTTHYYYNEKEKEQNEDNPYTPTVYNAFNGIEKKTVTDKSIIEYDYVTRKANVVNAFIFNAETNEIYPYTYEIEYPLLSKVTKTMNESNGTIKTNETYTYNKNFMKETESINDVDGIYTKKYVYPDSADIGILGLMAEKYMIGIPIETLLLHDGKVIDGRKTSYLSNIGCILPETE